MYVYNTWYVAAWSHEVTDKPTARTICELPLVLFRTQDGQAHALVDRCAHRGFPLSEGRVVNDSVECAYHGFTYGRDGRCTRVPGQTALPDRARVGTYPVHEKDGWIWVYTGDPERADISDIPDTHWHNDPEWAPVFHSLGINCRAELVHDNLLDLTHESWIHQTTVGDDYIYEYGVTVEVEGNTVSVDRFMPSVEAPPLYKDTMGISGPYDRFHCTEFHVPNHHTLHSGITAEGQPREDGYLIKVTNAITPIDADHCWYYYCFARNFAIDDEQATKDLEVGLATVLKEDAWALEHQERGLKTRPADEFDVLIAQDGGVAKARRIMNALIRAEQREAAAKHEAAEKTSPTVASGAATSTANTSPANSAAQPAGQVV